MHADLYSQSDNAQSESESESESESKTSEVPNASEEDFRIMTPPNTPDLMSPANSGIEDEGVEEWENIGPKLKPAKQRRGHRVSSHWLHGDNNHSPSGPFRLRSPRNSL